MKTSTFFTTFFLMLVFLLIAACAKKINQTPTMPTLSPEEKVTQLGEQLFKKDFSLDYNKEKTVVCIAKAIKRRPNDPFSTLSFVLYELDSGATIFEEIIPKATGKWLNNEEFQITTIPGRVPTKGAQKTGFVYNVSNKTKRKL